MSKRKQHVYAVIRVDGFDDPAASLEDRITVKEIVSSLEAAQGEVARLNKLNGPNRARYFWQTTRLILDEQPPNAT